LAVTLATKLADGAAVDVVVTAEAGDDEMRDRIARHRLERPGHWNTIEAPRALADALDAIDRASPRVLLVDCLSFWVANRVMDGDDPMAVEAEAERSAKWAASHAADVVVVSNEVGSGIVPDNELARTFRDTLGRVNAIWSARADRAFLVVAGRPLALGDSRDLLEA
jgi:adenosylcobinamide kinase / adenosylcobinamide-phosphate guanylyltransferase